MNDAGSAESRAVLLDAMRTANGHAFDGRRRPEYSNWIDEQLSWKRTCYIGDWSFLANVWLAGPDALALIAELSVNSVADFPVGRAKHLVQCDDAGRVVAEGVLVRQGEASFELHGVPGYWTAYHAETGDHDATAMFRDTFNYQVQGPTALAVLEAVTAGSLADLEFIHARSIPVAGRDVTAVRMGMSGEVGFELQGPAEHGEAVWAAVLEAGEPYGIRQLGARTSSINHLEACFPTRGRDYVPAIFDGKAAYRQWLAERATRDLLTYPVEGSFQADDISAWYRSPVELGWERVIGFDHPFVGRAALEAEVAAPERTIVTLVWDAEDVVGVYRSLFADGRQQKFMAMPHQQHRAMVADEVRVDGDPVGVSTCRGYSAFYREMLSLCVLDVEYADPGTEVSVVWGAGVDAQSPAVERHASAAVRATVAPAPYKPDNRRQALTDSGTS